MTDGNGLFGCDYHSETIGSQESELDQNPLAKPSGICVRRRWRTASS